ncbi:type II toxin-antitoxin system RelE/ParE family toxin [Candidatus Saccharibacteria bacterium]|nr:type II toxin-antitoxin system RelE/ParE family toxin [Candidatus Saccharibacteria bacterium]
MRKYIINYEDGAKHDILNIIDYIETKHDDSFNAAKVAIRIYKKCESLSLFPKAFPVHPEWSTKREYRAVHVKGYTIIYHVDDKKKNVNIIAIVNSYRDVDSLMK